MVDGKTWLKNSISVWDDITFAPNERRYKHPAPFPVALVERLLDCYLWNAGVVLDPFCGVGSTLVGAYRKGHSGIGFDVVRDYCDLTIQRLMDSLSLLDDSAPKIALITEEQQLQLDTSQQFFFIVHDDARRLRNYIPKASVDCVITSPPYWCILRRKRTADEKKSIFYSNQDNDLGNITDFTIFCDELRKIFADVYDVLKPNGYCIVVVMDLRAGAQFIPFHMIFSNMLMVLGFSLEDIIIWNRARQYNNLAPLGYPHKFIVNKVHEYVLIFRKPLAKHIAALL